jgi:hypothetical protein
MRLAPGPAPWEIEMKRLFLSLVVVGAALFGATQSWAATVATVNLGPLPGATNPVADEQKGSAASGDIDYSFSLANTSQLTFSSTGPVQGISGTVTTGISALSLELYDATNTLIGSASSSASGGLRSAAVLDLLGPGNYVLKVLFTKNVSRSLFDITTTVTTALAATPIPASGLLLLTALGGLGFVGYRRKHNAA